MNPSFELLQQARTGLVSFLRTPSGAPELLYYGTGESNNWANQCTAKAFSALAILGSRGDQEARSMSLKLLRYLLATHLSGTLHAANGGQWGRTWIAAGGSLERVLFAVDAIRESLADEDRAALRRILLNEADWLLDDYPIVAGIDGDSGKNKPESNIWNGALLLRTALDYPDAPRAAAYREKGLKFFVNGICIPSDQDPRLEGANFTENFGLNHHGYLNVGYMVICLSNIAITHFHYRSRGQEAPPEVYRHAADLWRLVKTFTFPDGRLYRIGGDTRIRYAYCQLYLLPVWRFAADYLGDADAENFEREYLKLLRRELEASGDGTFFKARLGSIRSDNYQYYCRLESDVLNALAFSAWHAGCFRATPRPALKAMDNWSDQFHGSAFLRTPAALRSWTARGAHGPVGLCVPPDHSDMAEWAHNLAGEFVTPTYAAAFPVRETIQEGPGWFVICSEHRWRTVGPFAEGEGENEFARQQFAAAALPDGRTMLVLEHSTALREIQLKSISGVNLKMPNDLFNAYRRHYRGRNFTRTLQGRPSRENIVRTGSDRLNIDDRLSVFLLYGAGELELHQSASPNIQLMRYPFLASLSADVIGFRKDPCRPREGEVLMDCGYAVATGTAEAAVGINWKVLPAPAGCRSIEFAAANGKSYRFSANFGSAAALGLEPGTARLEEVKP